MWHAECGYVARYGAGKTGTNGQNQAAVKCTFIADCAVEARLETESRCEKSGPEVVWLNPNSPMRLTTSPMHDMGTSLSDCTCGGDDSRPTPSMKIEPA